MKVIVSSTWVHKIEKYEVTILEVGGFKEYKYVMYRKQEKANCYAIKFDVFLQAFEPKEEK